MTVLLKTLICFLTLCNQQLWSFTDLDNQSVIFLCSHCYCKQTQALLCSTTVNKVMYWTVCVYVYCAACRVADMSSHKYLHYYIYQVIYTHAVIHDYALLSTDRPVAEV